MSITSEDTELQELSFIVGRMQSAADTFEDSLAVSYETKHNLNT